MLPRRLRITRFSLANLQTNFQLPDSIIDAYPRTWPDVDTLAEVETLLDQIEPAYQIINNRQREVLDLQLAVNMKRPINS